MDDIICLIRWMGVTQQRLRISMIPMPVLSGPISGETIETEIIEWARQARRWTIGAAEVFHYFIIKSKRMPVASACSWGVAFACHYFPLNKSMVFGNVQDSTNLNVLFADKGEFQGAIAETLTA
ncbi:unnamed protein product [Didymodactylos carnosus]|uniref:Uncharacterized protein n=1 Tax=Didymodactylos carnosus TaxID=1234261 RepID=A0A8S2FIK0_9BILA|nr:unnamed protein product [Didymodactylos carnosus]CAF4266999.1 unnamed protein product [Didymodactylos carnosus]